MVDSVPVVVILGATGAGKSRLALELAKRFGGEIINADAMQMYRGLDIVTNKVTAQEQEQVKHHVIDFLDPLNTNTVLDFRNRALPIVERLLKDGKIPFICGGTNYYIESLLWKILMDQDLPLILSDSRKRGHEVDGKLDGGAETGEEPPSHAPIPDLTELDKINFECDDNSVSSRCLHSLLARLDPARAEVLHPQERRKVWRSLQVLRQHGTRHSDLVASQGGAMGGGLRFPKDRVCLIEVWSEQAVLDARCDGRVEKMMQRGLIAELTDFHEKFNAGREQVRVHKHTQSPVPDYHKGIWQSIGFKEFHPYLVLGPEEREGEEGRKVFSKGVELMKTATRQYARRQVKWMKRFLISERDPPAFYRVNSSEPSEWEEVVYRPAEEIVLAVLAGRPPTAQPLPQVHRTVESIVDLRRTYHCDPCDRDFKGAYQFKAHTDSKGHKKVAKHTQGAREDYQLHVTLEGFKPEAKNESAKVLKNTFHIGLTDVFSLLSSVPCELAVIPGRGGGEAKVKSLMKEMAKHDIKLSYSRKAKLKE